MEQGIQGDGWMEGGRDEGEKNRWVDGWMHVRRLQTSLPEIRHCGMKAALEPNAVKTLWAQVKLLFP